MGKIRMNASEAIAETLLSEGVKVITGIVGSAFIDLLDILPAAGIRFVSVRHEQSAAHMADAYSRITGQAGVCIGQNGPGITNMVTGVAAGNMGHTPMVVISPTASSRTIGWEGFQECDTATLFKPVTKATIRVPHPDRIAECLRTAFRIAYAQRGAVLYDIPRDYFYAELEDEILPPASYRVDRHGPGPADLLDRAALLLREAQKPVILAGRGVVDTNALETVKQLAEYLTAPVAVTYLHNDAFYGDHPLYAGPIGYMGSKVAMRCLAEADVILALGTRLSVFGTLPQYDINYFPGTARIIQVNINPLHIGQVHPVTVGIIGDAGAAAKEILRRLQEWDPLRAVNTLRLQHIQTLKTEWEEELRLQAMVPGNPINPRRVLYEMARVLPPDAIVCTDIGNVCAIANSYLKFKQGRKHIAALTFGNTGFAYPAALGAKLARPDCPVVAIVGDGAWGMSLHEVSTAVEHNLPVIACVFNNLSWGAEKKNQIDFYNRRLVAVDIEGPVFAEVAKAMGAEGIRVDRAEEAGEALVHALGLNKPVVLEFMVDGEQLAPPYRRDALGFPRRYLEKYAHLDYRNWGEGTGNR